MRRVRNRGDRTREKNLRERLPICDSSRCRLLQGRDESQVSGYVRGMARP